jgi:glycosyltransferase involved in cell wall biosynthesis
MKRILIFSLNYYPKFIGGAEVAIKEITDRISPEEVEFHMIALRFASNLPRVEKIGNILVHRIGFTTANPSIGDLKKFPLHLNKYVYQLLASHFAHQLDKKYHYDYIWAMMAHSSGIPAGMFKKKHTQVKYLLTLQEGDPPEQIERMMRPVAGLFRNAFTRADELQAISTSLLSWGTRMGFKGSSHVIPNGADIAHFSHVFSSEEVAEEKSRLGKKKGEMYLVTTSRLVHKNAIDDVIRALSALPENVSFLVYGIGPDEANLRRLAAELSVSHRVRFMGHIAHTDMPLMLQACDIFIRPSRSEGMGNSFVEAMAAGIPVIATQEGGIRDFLYDEKRNVDKETTGWAVGTDSPEQIARAVTDILAHPEKVAVVKKNARVLVENGYNWNSIAQEMKKLFLAQ